MLVLEALVESSVEGGLYCPLGSDDRVLGFCGDCVHYFVYFCLEAFGGEKVGDVEAVRFLGIYGKSSQNHPLCYFLANDSRKDLRSTHSRNQA